MHHMQYNWLLKLFRQVLRQRYFFSLMKVYGILLHDLYVTMCYSVSHSVSDVVCLQARSHWLGSSLSTNASWESSAGVRHCREGLQCNSAARPWRWLWYNTNSFWLNIIMHSKTDGSLSFTRHTLKKLVNETCTKKLMQVFLHLILIQFHTSSYTNLCTIELHYAI